MNLPRPIADLLAGEKICFLATCQNDQPYLSMMNFTFLPAEELLIISTRRDRKKFSNMQRNPSVALLIYQLQNSCTIFGQAEVQEGEKAEIYRALHLAHHPDMAQFIAGPAVAIITIHIESAITADLQDKATSWRADGQQPQTSS